MSRISQYVALALALAAPAAFAAEDVYRTEIYRSVMPDGSVRYGESVAPGAKSYKKVAPPQASGVITVTPEESRKTITSRPGGVSVLPTPPHPVAPPAEAGVSVSPQGLPQRSY